MKIKRLLVSYIFVHVFTAPILVSSANAGTDCNDEINQIFDALPLDGKTVKKFSTIELLSNMRNGSSSIGFERWFSFDQCKGSLVIVVDSVCFKQTVYTRGNCEITGVKNY